MYDIDITHKKTILYCNWCNNEIIIGDYYDKVTMREMANEKGWVSSAEVDCCPNCVKVIKDMGYAHQAR